MVTAIPDTDYSFVKWSDNVMTASRTDTNVTADITVTATFVAEMVEQIGSWMDGAWDGYSHTAPAGSDRILLVLCHAEADAAGAVQTDFTSVTYGGQSCTQVVQAHQYQSGGTDYIATAEIWALDEAGIAAASGSTIVVTSSGTSQTRRISSVFYQNINQADPFGQTGTDGEEANNQQTLTVTLSGGELDAGDMVVANCSVRNDTSGDTSFAWQNGFAALGTYTPSGSPYLNYSDADISADGHLRDCLSGYTEQWRRRSGGMCLEPYRIVKYYLSFGAALLVLLFVLIRISWLFSLPIP